MSVTSVAIQFTIIDLLSRGVDRIKKRMEGLARSNKEVQNSFDAMARSAKYAAIAGVSTREMYRGLKPGVAAAGDMQEALLRVKGNLAGGVADAKELARQLREVKRNAITISAEAPFSAEDVVNIQNALLKAGVPLMDISGKAGAAFAATALSALSGEAPEAVGDALARIGSQFDLRGGQYGDLADWIVRVDDASATSVPELIQGLRMAGSNAQALGVSAKDSITALGALAPLGERAGSSFNNMLIGMVGVGAEQQRLLKRFKLNFFEDGKFVGLDKATAILKEKFGSIEDDQVRLLLLTKIFGEEGARAANTLISAGKGFGEIQREAAGALGLQDKLSIWAEGFNASMKKLSGTTRSTLATLFDPMLYPLTKIADLANAAIGRIGELAEEYRKLTVAGNVMAGGAVVAGGLATVGLAGAALWYGRKLLKGVGGVKGLFGSAASATAGIAAGKAVEAATGVTPVFVTNWPAGGLGGGTAADIAAGAAGGGLLGKAGALAKGGWKSLAGLATAATATVGGQFALAGAAGYGMGMGINRIGGDLRGKQNLLDDTALGDKIGELLNGIAALFGNEESKRAIEINMAIDQQGRVTTQSNDMKTSTNVNLKRGSF
jgi:TP901 family phage tail tape measure protein